MSARMTAEQAEEVVKARWPGAVYSVHDFVGTSEYIAYCCGSRERKELPHSSCEIWVDHIGSSRQDTLDKCIEELCAIAQAKGVR